MASGSCEALCSFLTVLTSSSGNRLSHEDLNARSSLENVLGNSTRGDEGSKTAQREEVMQL